MNQLATWLKQLLNHNCSINCWYCNMNHMVVLDLSHFSIRAVLYLTGFVLFFSSPAVLYSQVAGVVPLNGNNLDIRLDKGSFLLGGTLGLNLKSAENENQLLRTALKERSDKFSLRLDGAYALKDNWFLGLGLVWGETNREGDYEDPNSGDISDVQFHSTSYSVRPFMKNHLPLSANRRFNLVVQTELGFSLDQSIQQTRIEEVITRSLKKEWGMGLGIRPGLLVFVLKNSAMEASVNIAGIGFSVSEIKETDKPDAIVKSADLDLKIDLLQLNLGFITYF